MIRIGRIHHAIHLHRSAPALVFGVTHSPFVMRGVHEVLGRAWLVEPCVFEDILCECALLRVAVEHWSHEGLEELSLIFLEAIPKVVDGLLGNHDVFERPVL